MSFTVDANILVFASNEADPAHPKARALVNRIASGPELVYLFWPTLMGYMRIVTHPGIMPKPMTPDRAWRNVRALLDLPHVRAPGEEDGFAARFEACTGPAMRGNDVPDAHLAALMLQHGVRLIYTRDRGFRRFDGIEARDPIAAA